MFVITLSSVLLDPCISDVAIVISVIAKYTALLVVIIRFLIKHPHGFYVSIGISLPVVGVNVSQIYTFLAFLLVTIIPSWSRPNYGMHRIHLVAG